MAPPGSPNVNCIYHNATTGTDVPLTQAVSLQGPDRTEIDHDCGKKMQLLCGSKPNYVTYPDNNGDNPSAFLLWGANYPAEGIWGIYQVDALKDPAFLTLGSGKWGYVQTQLGYAIGGNLNANYSGLDSGFPYFTCVWTNADNQTLAVFEDAPGFTSIGDDFPFSGSYQNTFNLYLFYKPADDAAGASVYIPRRLWPWASKGHCSAPAPAGPWTQGDDGSGFAAGAVDYPTTFPTWP